MFLKIIKKIFKLPYNNDYKAKELVEYSIKKYGKTYKLLEEYDKGTKEAAEVLARPSPVREAFQKLS